MAIYYHRAGDFENALQHYRAVLRRNELDAQAHNNLGLLYQERHLLDESARELQRAIVIEPRNAAAHYNLAQLYDQTNQAARAVHHYGRFLENAAAEYASRVAAARVRIEVLTRDPD